MRRKLCHVFTACAQLPKLSFSKLLPPCHFRHVWRSKRDVCGFSNRWFCVPPSCRWLPWLPGAKVKDCGEKTGGNGLLFYEFTDLGFSWILHNMVDTREYLLGSVHAVHSWLCFSLFQVHSNAFPSFEGLQKIFCPFTCLETDACVHTQTCEYCAIKRSFALRKRNSLHAYSDRWCSAEDGKRCMHWPSGF